MVRGGLRGGPRLRGSFKKASFIPRHPFDLSVIENSVFFPRVTPVKDDSALLAALTKRNQELTPNEKEQAALNNLVTKVNSVLDNIVVAPGDFSSCQLEEVRQVGSMKKGTMRTGHSNNVADIVVIFKSIPTQQAIEALSKKVEENLKESMKTEVIPKTDVITVQLTEKGFDIFNSQAKACVLIATIPQNIRKVESIELQKTLTNSLSAIRHVRWFEENSNSSVKVLIRILRDLSTRFPEFAPMNPWMIDLLANFATLSHPNANRQALSLSQAFRRVFQLLSAGLFLPGSSGIIDPCENVPVRVHTAMTLEQQDTLCMASQTMLRVLLHGGYKVILGIEGGKKENIISEMSVWDGVVISPLKLAYEGQNDSTLQNADEEDEDSMDMGKDDSMDA